VEQYIYYIIYAKTIHPWITMPSISMHLLPEQGLAVPGPNSPLIIYPFKKAIGGVDGVL
jgi:hypothetical protein